ncbi:hypothetical protein NHQ30_003729 [Ciborinia camelliae]|nr:hypothetical protein NHQ30_003729 [Ciborinia camelliae]
MSLANLLPPLTKSWADEVNDYFEEQFLDNIASSSYAVDVSKLYHDSEIEEAEIVPPDFTDYEAIQFYEEERFESYAEMFSNNGSAAVITSSDQTISPNTDTLTKYMSIDIPKTLPYSTPGSKADIPFDNKFEDEKHKDISRDRQQKGTVTATKRSFEVYQESNNDLAGYLNEYSSSDESIQTTPELGRSLFSDHSSDCSLQTEEDEEEFRIDHPLMGKDVVGIQVSFVAVKSIEYDAHPSKVFRHGWQPQVWKWAPSNLRCCEGVSFLVRSSSQGNIMTQAEAEAESESESESERGIKMVDGEAKNFHASIDSWLGLAGY